MSLKMLTNTGQESHLRYSSSSSSRSSPLSSEDWKFSKHHFAAVSEVYVAVTILLVLRKAQRKFRPRLTRASVRCSTLDFGNGSHVAIAAEDIARDGSWTSAVRIRIRPSTSCVTGVFFVKYSRNTSVSICPEKFIKWCPQRSWQCDKMILSKFSYNIR